MTAKASGSRKIKRRSLPKFDHDAYSGISSGNLVVFSIHYLLERGIEVNMEDVVFGCFLLFPHRFALKKYPRWPDSAAVSRRVSDCRSKALIAANTEFGFKLTAKGTKLAERVAKALGMAKPKPKAAASLPKEKKAELIPQAAKKSPAPQIAPVEKTTPSPKPKEKTAAAQAVKAAPSKRKKTIVKTQAVQLPLLEMKKTDHAPHPKPAPSDSKRESAPTKDKKAAPVIQPTIIVQPVKKKEVQPAPSQVSREEKTRAAKFVRAMEISDAYRHYRKNGRNSTISEFDFRSLLLCTMESSSETLARNVELFKGYARIHNRQDLIAFLVHCEEYFQSLLHPPVRKTGRIKQLLRKVA